LPLLLRQIYDAVNEIAPFRLAYDWDNVGLQVGSPELEVQRLLIALEINPEVIAFAIKHSCEAVLAHHPLIFHPLRTLRSDTPAGNLQVELIRNNIALIAAHTNVDRVLRGTNGALAHRLELQNVKVLEPAAVNEQYKFTVFVPRDYTPKLIDAIHRGGGGRIGRYSHCTFRAPGTGTFVPEEGSNPFLGEAGKFEQANEDRLETVVSAGALKNVLNEVMHAHPYEEVAYDVYPLYDANPRFGLGAVGTLPTRMGLRTLAQKAREACLSEFTAFAGPANKQVKRVAIVTGSAGNTIKAMDTGTADVLVTGELGYHNTQEALSKGLCVITVGHAASEKIFADYFREELLREKEISESKIEILVFDKFAEPYQWVASGPESNGKINAPARQNKKKSIIRTGKR
jgi:dinuclear metal center YbgI/SA1388 family protein